MKMKKTLAGIAAAAMAATTISAFSIGASAISVGNVIDFEDGDCSFAYLNEDAGADHSILSVEDFEGSKQLKVDVQDHTAVPKVWFDLDKITARSNAVEITTIEMDLTFVPKNAEEAIGWAGGAIGTAGEFGKQVDPAWSDGQWTCEDNECYTPGAAAHQHISRKILLGSQKFTETGVSPFFGLMRWATETDYVIYIDNITLKNKAGDALPVGFAAAEEAPAEEAAVEEVADVAATPAIEEIPSVNEDAEPVADEAAPVEEVAVEAEPSPAPVADAATPVASTGNAAVASIAAVMALAGVASVVSKRK